MSTYNHRSYHDHGSIIESEERPRKRDPFWEVDRCAWCQSSEGVLVRYKETNMLVCRYPCLDEIELERSKARNNYTRKQHETPI